MNADCLIWEGKTEKGYGVISQGKGWKRAHRQTYEAQYGDVSDGYDVHHECDNKLCVNPHHLILMSKAEHTRLHRGSITHCKRGHILTQKECRQVCMECHRVSNNAYTARKRGEKCLPF